MPRKRKSEFNQELSAKKPKLLQDSFNKVKILTEGHENSEKFPCSMKKSTKQCSKDSINNSAVRNQRIKILRKVKPNVAQEPPSKKRKVLQVTFDQENILIQKQKDCENFTSSRTSVKRKNSCDQPLVCKKKVLQENVDLLNIDVQSQNRSQKSDGGKSNFLKNKTIAKSKAAKNGLPKDYNKKDQLKKSKTVKKTVKKPFPASENVKKSRRPKEKYNQKFLKTSNKTKISSKLGSQKKAVKNLKEKKKEKEKIIKVK